MTFFRMTLTVWRAPLLGAGVAGCFDGSAELELRKKWPPDAAASFGLGQIGGVAMDVEYHVTGIVTFTGRGVHGLYILLPCG